MLMGVQVVTDWQDQPVFSWGIITAGGVCILLAFIPDLWVIKAARTGCSNAPPKHKESISEIAMFQQLRPVTKSLTQGGRG